MAETKIISRLPKVTPGHLPALFNAVPESGRRFWEFFTVNIRNLHTRRAYFKAVETFAAWCAEKGLHNLTAVTPMHVAAYVEQLGRVRSKPTVKQHLAAIRMLFDWLVTGQVVASNPAHSVRGPKHSVKTLRYGRLSEIRQALPQANVHAMIQRRRSTW